MIKKVGFVVLMSLVVMWTSALAVNVVMHMAPGGTATVASGNIDLAQEFATFAYAAGANTTIDAPTNTTDNDILIAGFYIESDTTVTPPSGWTQIAVVANAGSQNSNIYGYWKRASSEPSSWTWVHASADRAGWVKRIPGCYTTGDPQDGTHGTVAVAFDTTMEAASVTTSYNYSAILVITGNYSGGLISAADLTERIDIAYVGLIGDIQASAGASGTKTVTFAGGGGDIEGITIGLRSN